jgi:hypothetical protein
LLFLPFDGTTKAMDGSTNNNTKATSTILTTGQWNSKPPSNVLTHFTILTNTCLAVLGVSRQVFLQTVKHLLCIVLVDWCRFVAVIIATCPFDNINDGDNVTM